MTATQPKVVGRGLPRFGSRSSSSHAINAAAGPYLAAQYWRFVRRMGKKKAAIAVGHSILVICWHLLASGCDNEDLGDDYFARRVDTARRQDRLVQQLQELGYPSMVRSVSSWSRAGRSLRSLGSRTCMRARWRTGSTRRGPRSSRGALGESERDELNRLRKEIVELGCSVMSSNDPWSAGSTKRRAAGRDRQHRVPEDRISDPGRGVVTGTSPSFRPGNSG